MTHVTLAQGVLSASRHPCCHRACFCCLDTLRPSTSCILHRLSHLLLILLIFIFILIFIFHVGWFDEKSHCVLPRMRSWALWPRTILSQVKSRWCSPCTSIKCYRTKSGCKENSQNLDASQILKRTPQPQHKTYRVVGWLCALSMGRVSADVSDMDFFVILGIVVRRRRAPNVSWTNRFRAPDWAYIFLLLDNSSSHACRLVCDHYKTMSCGAIEFQPCCPDLKTQLPQNSSPLLAPRVSLNVDRQPLDVRENGQGMGPLAFGLRCRQRRFFEWHRHGRPRRTAQRHGAKHVTVAHSTLHGTLHRRRQQRWWRQHNSRPKWSLRSS